LIIGAIFVSLHEMQKAGVRHLRLFLVLVGLVFFQLDASATHNRAGEITYQQIGDLSYRITVITYTATGPGPVADRPALSVQFGDGAVAEVPRIEEVFLPDYYKRNKYVWEHTYPGPGTYQIVVEDPNRNEGVKNIPNSVNTVFSIKTILVINPQIGYNNTPVLLNPPVDKAALGYTFIHNPAAFDPDGDSLSYKLAICTEEAGREIEGYTFPPFSDSLVVDELTGDLIWAAPMDTGKYNVAMTIEEWRNGIRIGRIQRDMQREFYQSDNHPPVIELQEKVCLIAGEFYETEITARDPDSDSINLTASGGPFSLAKDSAIFRQVFSVPGTAKAYFSWQTSCEMVRKQPYLVIIKAKDLNSEISLVDSKNLEIYINAPGPTELELTPGSSSMGLNWQVCPCDNIEGYRIYRRTGPVSFDPGPCDTGIPTELGYQLVGEVPGHDNTSYLDTNNGQGLDQSTEYCYRVIGYYHDGAETFTSNEACAELVKGFPLITKVSVDETHETSGKISLSWLTPTAEELLNTTGPYIYLIYRSEGQYGQNPVLIDSLAGLENTSYQDKGINTRQKAWSYQVQLMNAAVGNRYPIETAQLASSLFLDLEAHHQALRLNYSKNVPWQNLEYIIYRGDESIQDSIGRSEILTYLDQNLEDGQRYCYRVKSIGEYEEIGYRPIVNYSQISCGIPVDSIPPCPPILNVQSVCDSLANRLRWNNVADSCAFDAAGYRIYYRSVIDGEMIFIDSVAPASKVEFWHFPDNSMAACYAATAIDSVGNESDYSNIVCVDDCINYELPNVFTPNGDGINDLLRPYPHNLVERIDLKVYGRWGNMVFQTNDPDINWDASNMNSRKKVPPGVYYYICDVYERRLTGVEPRYLVGFIHVLYSDE